MSTEILQMFIAFNRGQMTTKDEQIENSLVHLRFHEDQSGSCC